MDFMEGALGWHVTRLAGCLLFSDNWWRTCGRGMRFA